MFLSCVVSGQTSCYQPCMLQLTALFLWIFFSCHLPSDYSQEYCCRTMHIPRFLGMCVLWAPAKCADKCSKLSSVYYSIYSADIHFSSVLLCFLPKCLTSTRVSHQYTRVPSSRTFLPPHSPDCCSLLFQSTGFGCPASCTELAPVICLCTVMYMFQSYSLKSSHCCPLHRVQKSVLSISVSFAALHVGSS